MALAHDLRPTTLKEFIGQEHLVGKNKVIERMIKSGNLFSMIFWGPPGCGKTTLAQLLAKQFEAHFYQLSGVTSGKEDLLKIVRMAQEHTLFQKKTILFIDEIHRWNKAQQDALLPYVENGTITLIGATTENPSFEIISPLLSRSRIFVFYPLQEKDLKKIAVHALTDTKRGLGTYGKILDTKTFQSLYAHSSGDARVLLNALEIACMNYSEKKITAQMITEIFQNREHTLYDKKGEMHYNLISAFIKSMRASKLEAALYYMVRILEGGEKPEFIARRMLIFASEDIGLADRAASIVANQAFSAVSVIGMPEAQLILAHAVLYLTQAKKSRDVANALSQAQLLVKQYPNEPVPLYLRNAPTKLMKDLGYGKDYVWSEDFVGVNKNSTFLPESIKNKK